MSTDRRWFVYVEAEPPVGRFVEALTAVDAAREVAGEDFERVAALVVLAKHVVAFGPPGASDGRTPGSRNPPPVR